MTIAKKHAQQYMPNGEVSLEQVIQAAIDEAESLLIVGARERIRQMETAKWQPIESSPKGDDFFLVRAVFFDASHYIHIVGRFEDDGFYLEDGSELSYSYTPTYWMPLQQPQKEEE